MSSSVEIRCHPEGAAEGADPRSWLREDDPVLSETCLEMPVSFVVQGFNVLGSKIYSFSRPIPVLKFVFEADGILEALTASGQVSTPLPGDGSWIHFRRTDQRVEIFTSEKRRGLYVEMDELRAAFEAYRKQVKSVLETEYPVMKQHPKWGRWFDD